MSWGFFSFTRHPYLLQRSWMSNTEETTFKANKIFFDLVPFCVLAPRWKRTCFPQGKTRAAVGPCHSSTVQASLDCSSCADGQKSRYNVRGRDKTTAQYKLLSEKNALTITKRSIYSKNVCPPPVSLTTSTRKELLLAAACSVI